MDRKPKRLIDTSTDRLPRLLPIWITALALGIGVALVPVGASAETPVGVRLGGGLNQAGKHGQLGLRLGLGDSFELGLDSTVSALDRAFVGGLRADGGTRYDLRLVALTTLATRGRLTMVLRTAAGGRRTMTTGTELAEPDSVATVLDFGPIAIIRVTDDFAVRTGFSLPLSFEITPAFALDEQGVIVFAGLEHDLGAGLSAWAQLDSGGVFGSDGDSEKFLLQGLAGIRWRYDQER